MCTTIITNVTNIDKKVVERAAKKRQKNGATSPARPTPLTRLPTNIFAHFFAKSRHNRPSFEKNAVPLRHAKKPVDTR